MEVDSRGIAFASSRATDPSEAMADIAARVDMSALAGALIFCSHSYDRDQLARAICRNCEELPVIGCTSSGELTETGYDQDSISFIGFSADAFHFVVRSFDDLNEFQPDDAREAVRALSARAEIESRVLGDSINHAALFFVDGLSHREELLTITVQHALGETPLIGGSSGDGLLFRETGIFYSGTFHSDCAVVAILSTIRPLYVFKTQHYRPGDIKMVITGADPLERKVTEINAEPAAAEYRRLAGIADGPMGASLFAMHPPMVRAGGEYHVRAIQAANADGSLSFYGAIDEGLVLTLGEPVDVVKSIDDLIADIADHVGEIDHIIGFDCVLNRIAAEQRQLSRDVSARFVQNHVVGFNTYGEQFHGLHVNQTFSGLAIGR